MSDDVRRWSDDQIRRYQAELHNSYARRFEPISKESLRKANLWDELTNMPHPAVDPEVGALLAPTKYTADRAGSRRERIATFLMLEGECSVQGISEETNIRQDKAREVLDAMIADGVVVVRGGEPREGVSGVSPFLYSLADRFGDE